MKKYSASLFIFTRDLRIYDNKALQVCVCDSDSVIPIFIFNAEQADPKENEYFSQRSFDFLLESLDDLREQFKEQKGTLFFEKNQVKKVIEQAKSEHNIKAVYISRDLTPFSRDREDVLKKNCTDLDIDFHVIDNLFLNPPEKIETGGGTPYKVFTPFKNRSKEFPVDHPADVDGEKVWQKTSSFQTSYRGLVQHSDGTSHEFVGGRSAALERMQHIKQLANYKTIRDFPAKDGTSKLSPHIKFGTLSIRELYWFVNELFGSAHQLITELYWRDFYAHLTFHFPKVLQDGENQNFKQEYKNISWENDKELFEAWCEGRTGFPIVDAGMRQLNQTGWMHNRVRMIVASFLTKDLHIDWRWGEKYFAQALVDYDPMTNNGSWQWAASTGADAQPYFRIFNPWRQQERFDPDCEYIKKYVPELSAMDGKDIHRLENNPSLIPRGYVQQIVDHQSRVKEAKDLFV